MPCQAEGSRFFSLIAGLLDFYSVTVLVVYILRRDILQHDWLNSPDFVTFMSRDRHWILATASSRVPIEFKIRINPPIKIIVRFDISP